MRARALVVLVLLASLAVQPAAGHQGGDTMRTLLFSVHDGEQDGATVSWFQLANRTNANPTITVMPDERVAIHLYNAGNRSHNLRVAPPIQTATPPVEPGNETHISMKVPEDAAGTIPYYDQEHREDGAEGTFRVAGTSSGDTTSSPFGDPLVWALAVGGAVVALGWWSGRRR